MKVSRISRNGHLIWQFNGADIFAKADSEAEFLMQPDGLLLTDFEGAKYKVDYDGKLLWDTIRR